MREVMTQRAASLLRDGETVLVGVGAPGEAAALAKRTHAPGLELIYESGAVGSQPAGVPLSIGDPTLFSGALAAMSLGDLFAYVIEGGMLDTAFVGAAEIDRFARLNSTVVGDYEQPKVRLPGSGGACEMVDRARRVLVLSPLQPRRFPAEVGFVTSRPPAGTEVVVVTDQCVLRRPAGAEELMLDDLYDGVSFEQVDAAVGWPLKRIEDSAAGASAKQGVAHA